MSKSILFPSIVLSTAMAFGGSCGEDTTVDKSTAINIIVAFPSSGSFAERGELYLRTTQMAVNDLQEAGDLIPGRKIIIHQVNSGDGKELVTERTKAIVAELGKENVAAIMSATGAAHKGSVVVAVEEGIPHFEWASGSRDDEVLGDTYTMEQMRPIFQLRGLCPSEAEMTANVIYKENHLKVGLMRGTKDHDKMHTSVIRGELAKYAAQSDQPWQGEVINDEDFEMQYDDQTSWKDYLDQYMEQYPDTDVLFYHLRGDTVNFSFLKAAKARFEAGLPMPKILTCDMARKPALLDPIETNVADYLVGRFYFIGRGPLSSDLGDTFVTDLKARYDVDADRWAKTGYDSMILTGLAIASTQSTDHNVVVEAIYAHSKSGQKVSFSDIGVAITAARSGMDIDYTGVSGELDIREANGTTIPDYLDRTVESRYYVEDIVSDGAGGFEFHPLESIPAVVQ